MNATKEARHSEREEHPMTAPANTYTVIEFWGTGDPFFGGSADDRPLGKAGAFLRGCYRLSDVAEFPDQQTAIVAAHAASNRRRDGRLSVLVTRPAGREQ